MDSQLSTPNNWSTMPDNARVWVYQSNRLLTKQETEEINLALSAFMATWAAHGKALAAQAKVVDHHFIVVMLDQSLAMASGCSIDSCVHFIQSLEAKFHIDFFDRLKLVVKHPDGRAEIHSLNDLKEKIKQELLNADSMVYNVLVEDKTAFNEQWLIPLSKTWAAKRLF